MPSNKDVARSVVEDILGRGQYDLVDRYYAEDYLGHDVYAGKLDRDGLRQEARAYLEGFPDKTMEVEECFGEGDTVCVRWSVAGTNTGPLFGMAPTGRQFRVSGIRISHFKDGRITEEFASWDTLGFFHQLGIVSLPQYVHAPPFASEDSEARAST